MITGYACNNYSTFLPREMFICIFRPKEKNACFAKYGINVITLTS